MSSIKIINVSLDPLDPWYVVYHSNKILIETDDLAKAQKIAEQAERQELLEQILSTFFRGA